ncbi:hypothetical protein [Rhodococcus sp. NPDC127528]|uniref:hypothetical protein n=1 Tax=unclassified Rhodococcus (in: high G+C Gram-positive bacteria) TaxID=192944 RepID=UPI00362854F6
MINPIRLLGDPDRRPRRRPVPQLPDPGPRRTFPRDRRDRGLAAQKGEAAWVLATPANLILADNPGMTVRTS